jgi:hypothetical protein
MVCLQGREIERRNRVNACGSRNHERWHDIDVNTMLWIAENELYFSSQCIVSTVPNVHVIVENITTLTLLINRDSYILYPAILYD